MDQGDPGTGKPEQIVVLLEAAQFEPAARLAGEVISAEPRNAKAWCLMARAQLGRDRPASALAAARAASSISPHAELPHRLACEALIRLGRGHDAVAAAREAVRFGPRHWETHHALSHALLAVNACNDARLAAEHAAKLAPEHSEPHIAIGLAARCQHRLREARAAFEHALTVDPENATAQHHLITLRHRTITPRGLARAVNSFAEAADAGQNPRGNRQSTEFTVAKFLSRFALLLAYGAAVGASPAVYARPAAVLLLALDGLYASFFLISLRPRVRAQLTEMILHSRKLKLAWALEAVATAAILANAIASTAAHRAAVTVGGLCACAAAILVQFARLGTMRDVAAPDSGLVYRRNVRWLALTVGLSVALGFGALQAQDHGHGALVLIAAIPALGFLVVRARTHARAAR